MSLSANDLARTRRFLDDLGTSEIQQLSVNATAGTYTLTYGIDTTSAIAWNATAGAIQNALATLPSIGLGNISVSLTNPFNINFTGLLGNVAVYVIIPNTVSLTGTATVTELTQGGITAFSDAELQDNYSLANANFFLGVYYGVLQLLESAAKFSKYTVGQTEENKHQIFDHLKVMADAYYQRAIASSQVSMAGAHPIPARNQPHPYTVGNTISGNNMANSAGWFGGGRNFNNGGDF